LVTVSLSIAILCDQFDDRWNILDVFADVGFKLADFVMVTVWATGWRSDMVDLIDLTWPAAIVATMAFGSASWFALFILLFVLFFVFIS